MTAVLVTGATTPVGRALVRRLLDDPDVERVLAVGIERDPAVALGPDVEDPRVVYERVDLTRPRHVRRLLFGPARDLSVEVIAHLALHRRATESGPQVRLLNVESTRELLSLAEEHPTIRRFVFRSYAEVYDVRGDRPLLLGPDHPLNLRPGAPQWIRDRVEADLTVCARAGARPLDIVVLRAAECLACDCGSQLNDYLESAVCMSPLGFDPMINLITVEDLANALVRAIRSEATGIFTIPGRDTLPLSEVVRKAGRVGIPVPGPLLTPLYWLRARTIGTDFRYDLNRWRFHFSGVLDGSRAREELGYEPTHPIEWPTDDA